MNVIRLMIDSIPPLLWLFRRAYQCHVKSVPSYLSSLNERNNKHVYEMDLSKIASLLKSHHVS